MSIVIDLDARRADRQRRIEVRVLGACLLGPPTIKGQRRLNSRLHVRPVNVRPGATVDELISVVCREPGLTVADVAQLPTTARRRFRLAALEVCGAAGDYRRLRGSHLSPDERAHAALIWRGQRQAAELPSTLVRVRERQSQLAGPTAVRSPPEGVARSIGAQPLAITQFLQSMGHVTGPHSLDRLTRSTRQLDLLGAKLPGFGFAESVRRGLGIIPRSLDLQAINSVTAISAAEGARRSVLEAVSDGSRADPIGAQLRAASTFGLLGLDRELSAVAALRDHPTGRLAAALGDQSLSRFEPQAMLPEAFSKIAGRYSVNDPILKHTLPAGWAQVLDPARADILGLFGAKAFGGTFDAQLAPFRRRITLDPFSGPGGLVGALSASGLLGKDAPWRTLIGADALRDLTRGALEWLERSSPVILLFERLRPRFAAGPLAWLLDLLSMGSAVAVMSFEADAGLEALLDHVAEALVAPGVLDSLKAGVSSAPMLPRYAREWLLKGLAELRGQPDWVGATPLLTWGVEGAYRHAARAEGLIVHRDGKDRIKLSTGGTRPANGIEVVFDHIQLDDDRVIFLKQGTYGGSGNQFRHALVSDNSDGTARRHTACLLLALTIWIERFVDANAMEITANALEARAERLQLASAA